MGSGAPPDARDEPVEVFIGRQFELAELEASMEDALGGRGRLLLVSGDAGMGKTRLADQLAAAAPEEALVSWGRSWEEPGAPPYWPWIQIVRGCLREVGVDDALRRMGSGASDLAGIVPEVRAAIAAAPEYEPGDGVQGRFELFDALTSFLIATSEEHPLVLILDDLHTMDVTSLLLLNFVARQVRQLRGLVFGAYRDIEAGADPERADLIARIAREGVTLRLDGLDVDEVRDLVERTARQPVSEPLAAEVQHLTQGNPLFVTELARILAARRQELAEGLDPAEALATNESVRHTIRRRLDLLSDGAVALLSVAAVFGREFDATLIQEVSERSAAAVADLLGEARRVGIISEASPVPPRYRFRHALIRDVLYETLAPPHRLELHLRIAHALEHAREESGREGAEAHLGELAHHFCQAAHAGVAAEAAHYAVLAAEEALERFAWAEGADWYRRALEAFELQEAPGPEGSCDLLIGRGRALARAGRSDEARAVFVRAKARAGSIGSADHLAQAALGYGWVAMTTGVADQVLIAMLEEALSALDDEPTALRVDVMTRLVLELLYVNDPEPAARRVALAAQATELARQLGDPLPLIYALEAAAWAGAGPDNVEQRLDAGAEIIRLAHQHDLVLKGAPMGHLLRFPALLEQGNVQAAERELGDYERVAETLKEPDLLWYVTSARAAMALMAGRFDDAERSAREALEIGEPARPEEARQYFGVQMLTLLRERGDTDELGARVGKFEELATRFPALPAIRAAVGCVYAEIGRDRAAAATLERLRASGVGELPRNSTWLASVALTAELCAYVGDVELARVLHGQLEPYASHQVVFDAAVVCLGSAGRYLGLLAATMGDRDGAIAHLERAAQHDARTGARPYRAHAEQERARALLERDGPGDREAARELATAALDTARDLGMTHLVDTATALLDRSGGTSTVRDTEAPSITAEFRRKGDLWALAFGGDRIHLSDLQGYLYLARLLGNPGVEVHVLDLAAGVGGRPDHPAAHVAQEGLTVSAEDAGPVLDERAKAEYRERLEELREQIEDAEAMNDPVRASNAREEMDFLMRELSAAVGLGGRDRKAASSAERARVNVTRTLRRAIDRIAEANSTLGEHLDVSVQTGTYCCYRPDPSARVTWDVVT